MLACLQGYLGDRPFPASVDRSKYAALYLVNSGGDFFATDDLTQLPVNKTEVPYLLASSNRCGAVLESPGSELLLLLLLP